MQCIRRLNLNLTNAPIRSLNKFSQKRINTVHLKIAALPVATRLFAQLKYNTLKHEFRQEYSTSAEEHLLDIHTFDRVSEETLESLTEYFEELVESDSRLANADVSYSSGVLTISFGKPHGTYVINKQTPNRQIWLSSPTSGPKRYDFVAEGEYWIYRHTEETLHRLLQDEIPKIVGAKVDFARCSHSRF